MKLNELHEGLFGKKEQPKNEIFSDEDRNLIKRLFPTGTNVDLKKPGSKDEYLFPENVHGTFGRGHLVFYKRNGQLKVSVGHYSNNQDPGDPKKRPLLHKDYDASVDELERLKKDLA